MSLAFQSSLEFSAAAEAALDGEALIVDLEGYEGPLDLLLALARAQKVDLLKISVARLADQYLDFVRCARRRRFALAADYLVMAAWLAYLKSRLLLPKPRPAAEGEVSAEEAAARLAARLARLDAMRRAGEALEALPVFGREVLGRGDPDAVRVCASSRLDESLHGLIAAYVAQRRRREERSYRPPTVQAWPLEEAREHIRAVLPSLRRWTAMSGIAPGAAPGGPPRASCLASTLFASLEMVREGGLEVRQLLPFEEVYVRGRKAAA